MRRREGFANETLSVSLWLSFGQLQSGRLAVPFPSPWGMARPSTSAHDKNRINQEVVIMRWPLLTEPNPEVCKEQKQAHAEAMEQFGKYVNIAKANGDYQVFFEVGNQGFFVADKGRSAEEAEFMRVMLCAALYQLEQERKTDQRP